jgi:hypothetical protein
MKRRSLVRIPLPPLVWTCQKKNKKNKGGLHDSWHEIKKKKKKKSELVDRGMELIMAVWEDGTS